MSETTRAARLDWSPILTRAAAIVREYDTGVTLRQLFYRLVATQVLPNTQNAYEYQATLDLETEEREALIARARAAS